MDILARYNCDGYTQIEFEFKGKKAIALLPPDDKKNGKTILKPEYFGAFPDLQLEFVRRGYTMLFLSNRNRWGTDSELADQYEFINYMAKELNISNKVITIGMSCGGMMSVLLAAKYPDCIEALYIDAPVMNFFSCPANMCDAPDVLDSMWVEFENAWGMTKRDLMFFRGHPVDMIPDLVKNKVKIYMAYGDSDKTVPYEENGIALERAYRDAGLSHLLYLDKKVGCDHHPHGPTNIDFAIKYFEDQVKY